MHHAIDIQTVFVPYLKIVDYYVITLMQIYKLGVYETNYFLSHGVYDTYTGCNLRYSQNAPLNMYDEVNTGCNLPAQIDLYAVDGDEYKFLFVAKGGVCAEPYLLRFFKKSLFKFHIAERTAVFVAACRKIIIILY